MKSLYYSRITMDEYMSNIFDICRFQNVFTVRTSRLKSFYLTRIVLAFGVIALSPIIVWNIMYPIQINDFVVSSSTYCWVCTYPTAVKGNWGFINVAEIIVLVWCVMLIIISAFLAFKVLHQDKTLIIGLF